MHKVFGYGQNDKSTRIWYTCTNPRRGINCLTKVLSHSDSLYLHFENLPINCFKRIHCKSHESLCYIALDYSRSAYYFVPNDITSPLDFIRDSDPEDLFF